MVGFHRDLNRETAGSWASFAPHRARVTELVTAAATATVTPAGVVPVTGPGAGAPRIAILGAGNCNDLALDQIAACFGEVHLVDIDRDALLRARDRQEPATAGRLVLHAPVDLGGAIDRLAAFRRRPAAPAQLAALPEQAARPALALLPGGFDVVVSVCIISQLVHGCERLLGSDHPQGQDLAGAVVVAHLRLATQLCRPGGRVLIVTDTVSSGTYPLEELWSHRTPRALLDELDATGNHLTGTSPRFLRRVINTDPLLSAAVGASHLYDPWLWQLGRDETYLVYALMMVRAGDGRETA
jgi:hypothetical protein